MNLQLLQNSLVLSVGVAVLAGMLGMVGALAFLLSGPRLRGWLLGASIAVPALPSFLVTAAWMRYTQPGSWAEPLQDLLYSLPGAVVLIALQLWPVAALSIYATWRRLPSGILESEPMLRGVPLLRYLLLPAARGPWMASLLVIGVLALGNFAVPAILQVKVLPVQMWIRFNTDLNVAGALWSALPLVFLPMLALFWLLRLVPKGETLERPSVDWWAALLGKHFAIISLAGYVIILSLSLGFPLFQLLVHPGTYAELPMAVSAGRSAIFYSAVFSGLGSSLVVLAGLALRRFRIAPVIWLLFFLPGVLMQIGFIGLFNRDAFAWIYPGLGVVLFALLLKYVAPARALILHGVRTSDRGLAETALLSGASHWQWFRHVYWPQNAAYLAAAWYVTFLLCLWDVESLVLVVPPGVETLALRVFNLLHYGHNAQVNSLCLILLLLAVAPLVVWASWRRWRWGGAFLLPVLLLAGCGREEFDSRLFSSADVFGKRGAGLGEFNKPRSIITDRAGNFFVADMTGRIQKFSPDGQFLLSWQMPQTDLGRPKGMGCDKEGNILVNEPHYSRVNHFSPEGSLVRQWGAHGTNAGQLAFPRSIAANSKNELIVSEYGAVERVQVFSPAGDWLRSFGERGNGPGQFNRPEGVAVDAQDRIYVADSCNHRIQVFSETGEFLRSFGTAGIGLGELSYPYDVAIGLDNRVYVCEFGNSRVQVFEPDGTPLEIIGGAGDAPGRFNNPWGLAFDPRGNLYVADALNHRVQRLNRASGILAKGTQQ